MLRIGLTRRSLFIAVPLAAAATVLALSPQAAARGSVAQATLRLADGRQIGHVLFTDQPADQATRVYVRLRVPAGVTATNAFHGIHIHANDNRAGCVADPKQPPATWFVSVGGHLRSGNQTHGDHDGDFPSLLVNNNGAASLSFTTGRVSAAGLGGRAVILHAGSDNFGNVPVGSAANQYTANGPAATQLTEATGNAGNRIACGIITATR